MSESECAICCESVTADTGRAIMSCKHEFHMRCLVQWLQKPDGTASCPCCRHTPSAMEQLVPPPSDSESEDEDDEESEGGESEGGPETTNITPLMYAAAERPSSFDDIRRLLAAGADVDAVDSDGDTALAYAIGNHNYEATAMLLEAGADVCALATYGKTHSVDPATPHSRAQLALFKACSYNSIACAAAAIAAGANVNYALKPSMITPLMEAVSYGVSSALVQYLVTMGADVFARDDDGWNAFMWFAKECRGDRSVNDLETMSALLEAMGPRTKQWVISDRYTGGNYPQIAAETIQYAWRYYFAQKKANASAKSYEEVKASAERNIAAIKIKYAWRKYLIRKSC